MPKRYTIKRADRAAARVQVGDTVYAASCHDYGLARDDTRLSGIEYVSVTFNEMGGYPFFTIPLEDLQAAGDEVN